MLALAGRVLAQKQHRRGPKIYSLHAPEVMCIGRGKAPYDFGGNVSVAMTQCRRDEFSALSLSGHDCII
ncbi:hypothetical protein E4K65_44835 [Bradyrhizobium niftali]|uniref:Uncharacterized protein n=1 Tax=Bradyrhizobium niftali TaxID=2560055 RepID=A0A4Y9L1F7_9BRAD|nr:hypothetical protein E4K65_44835 [Bradyrhizobium niftali]